MIEVALGVIIKDNKILMVKRTKQEGHLSWVFPGGKVEKNETKEEACIREVYEETGLTVSLIKEIGKRVHPDTGVKLNYYLCDYITGDVKILNKSEISEISYKSKEEFNRDVKTDMFEPVKQYIMKNIK